MDSVSIGFQIHLDLDGRRDFPPIGRLAAVVIKTCRSCRSI